MAKTSPVIVWYRLDLRLADNPALTAACELDVPVIPVYLWSPEEEGDWAPASASRYWLHQALTDLDRQLRGIGSRLVLRRGPCLEVLQQLIKETGADTVFWNRCYEPRVMERDSRIKKTLRKQEIIVSSFKAGLLFEPHEIKTGQGKPYKVYTPFSKNYQGLVPDAPLNAPESPRKPSKWPRSCALDDFELKPEIPWTAGIDLAWDFTAQSAIKSLDTFLDDAIDDYEEYRDIPAVRGVSRLSPYLHFGQISPGQIWHAVCSRENRRGRMTPSKKSFVYLKQIVWREFAYHLLYHFPHTPDKPLYDRYQKFPWKRSKKNLQLWQQGKTGYPVVDAGMRELWHTGWMHNRVRMIVASFLVKDLMIHWREGARWFWDTLVDADLANNTMGWQWVAGCGADAAPYFRIFNPVTQGKRYDPDGSYIRQWVPELAKLDHRYIHNPWLAPIEALDDAGIDPGDTYPQPMVDHKAARDRALAAYRELGKGLSNE